MMRYELMPPLIRPCKVGTTIKSLLADAMKERHAEAAHSETYSHESRRHARGNAVTAEEVARQIRALASAPPDPVESDRSE